MARLGVSLGAVSVAGTTDTVSAVAELCSATIAGRASVARDTLAAAGDGAEATEPAAGSGGGAEAAEPLSERACLAVGGAEASRSGHLLLPAGALS